MSTDLDLKQIFEVRLSLLLQQLAQNPPQKQLDTISNHQALELLGQRKSGLAQELSAEVHQLVHLLVAPKLQEAILSRTYIFQKWPLPEEGFPDAWLPRLLRLQKENQPSTETWILAGDPSEVLVLEDNNWPPGVAVQAMAEWAEKNLNRASGKKKVGSHLLKIAMRGLNLGAEPRNLANVGEEEQRGIWIFDHLSLEDGKNIPVLGIALVYQAVQDVEAGLRRPIMAIDASSQHHSMVSNMRDWPQDRQRHRGELLVGVQPSPDDLSRIELFSAGEPVQLNLPWGDQSPHDSTIEALRRLRGSKGLRHWCALQSLFSVEGHRQGWVRWLLDEHLEAMGYDERQRRDQKVRDEAAAEVEALAALELAVYGKDRVLRHRAPLLLVGNRHERLVESSWRLDGMELRINDLLYRGVREADGRLGSNWMPAPVELARLDHVRHPYVHALGLVFAIRVRWRLGEGESSLVLKGRNLLALAGIEVQTGRPKRAWTALRETLLGLQQIGLLREFSWDPGEAPWSMDGTCRLYPSAWLVDRVQYGITLPEGPPDNERPVTGGELKIWRKKRGWSQQELAEKIGFTQGSIHYAESKPDHKLGSRLLSSLRMLSLEPPPPKTELLDDKI